MKPPLFQFVLSVLSLNITEMSLESGSVFSAPSLQIFIHIDETLPAVS